MWINAHPAAWTNTNHKSSNVGTIVPFSKIKQSSVDLLISQDPACEQKLNSLISLWQQSPDEVIS